MEDRLVIRTGLGERLFARIVEICTAAVLLSGCASRALVLDVTELTPPRNVTAVAEDSVIVVRWQPSTDENQTDFAGYNLYVSTQSLMVTTLTSDGRLPPPIVLGKEHEKALRDLEPGKRYFIHVRSRLEDGRLSVGSLPEVEVVLPVPKNL